MCELPYGRVASAQVGGAGGTCVLRGCVPKKLMVFGGEFAEAFRDSVAFGCGWMSVCMVPSSKFAEAFLVYALSVWPNQLMLSGAGFAEDCQNTVAIGCGRLRICIVLGSESS